MVINNTHKVDRWFLWEKAVSCDSTDKIKAMLNKYRAETIDFEDITYEEADLEEESLFQNDKIKESG